MLSTAVEGGDQTLELVRYQNQPGKAGRGVPDAQITGSFNLLFETKVVPDAVDREQLKGHLQAFDGDRSSTERLYVLSPDGDVPGAVTDLADDRVRWMSFAGLNQAIDEYVALDDQVHSDRDLFLLRQLQQFLWEEKLLRSPDDVVVVPAGSAWDEYRSLSAYICQPGRSFRGVDYMGFYRNKQIESHIPKILHVRDHMELSLSSIEDLRKGAGSFDIGVADVLDRLMTLNGSRKPGALFKVFILSGFDDDRTVVLPAAIPHREQTPWARGQRYTSLKRLRRATTTADL